MEEFSLTLRVEISYSLSSIGKSSPSDSVLGYAKDHDIRINSGFYSGKALNHLKKTALFGLKSTTIIFREKDGIAFPVASLRKTVPIPCFYKCAHL